jgi:PAS domain S-box-containing protein
MPALLRILVIEDHPADVEMMLYELNKAGYELEYACVETEADFLHELMKPYDLILADYTLPQFSGMRALELLQERDLDIPFILISGTIDEEIAVQAIKRGASDYVLKDRLARLGPAIEQAITSRKLRLENKSVEKSLHESEAKFRNLVQQAMEGIILIDEQGKIVEWNKGLEVITGIPRDQALIKPCWEIQFQLTPPELKTPERYSYLQEIYLRAIETRDAPWFRYAEVQKIVRSDGTFRVIEGRTFPVETEQAFWLCSVIRDVTGNVEAEQEIRRRADQAEALVRVAGKLTAKLDLESVLYTVCRETSHALRVQATMVLLYDSGSDLLEQRAFYCLTKASMSKPPSIPLPVFESYAPPNSVITILPDLGTNKEWELTTIQKELDARTAVYLRMSHNHRFVGILAVYACGLHRAFSEDELNLLNGFANQAAMAISNAWLFEQIQKGRDSLQALSRRLVEVQEEERRSIACELHDEIGQALTGLKMLFDTLPELTGTVAERLEMGRSLVVDLIERTRRISLDLRPSMLDDLGLLPALFWHFERCRDQSRLEIDFKQSGMEKRFPASIETAAYRIIQESCTNIIRHAGVNLARIRVWADTDALHIQVEDKGVGFDQQSLRSDSLGGGLSGMRERAVLLGGSLVIRSTPTQGTTLTARLPLQDHLERRDATR